MAGTLVNFGAYAERLKASRCALDQIIGAGAEDEEHDAEFSGADLREPNVDELLASKIEAEEAAWEALAPRSTAGPAGPNASRAVTDPRVQGILRSVPSREEAKAGLRAGLASEEGGGEAAPRSGSRRTGAGSKMHRAKNTLRQWHVEQARQFREANNEVSSPVDKEQDFVVTVEVTSAERDTVMVAFDMLGSQSLADLRRHPFFYCASDHVLGDVVRHGAFFFIENAFFDTEWEGEATPAAQAGGGTGPGLLSDPCRRWLAEERKRRRAVGPTFLRSVHTPLRAVHARLGACYLYRHQGDCEHRVRFTGVRLLTEGDAGDALEYPRQVFQGAVSRRKCYACKARFAQHLAYGDPLSPENPTLLCEKCFDRLHVDGGGVALHALALHPYSHD